ncbi:HAMP domain-containing sensor histidine kinase [Cohnella nanjingensis]|uniref:HAMP domain-containing sensor histidine kinase n=1 Tax=Cohnella nanjingensis TaxID=1387779 RepID=UPI0028A6D56E|nr:HAMP domain-containing sensor histidine kinase [Cohnella nanjingensis]
MLTFLASIIIGLIAAFGIGLAVFENKLNALGQKDMIAAGDHIIGLYAQTKPRDLDAFMNRIAGLTSYPIQLFTDAGEMKSYGWSKPDAAVAIAPESIRQVRDGEIYRSKQKVDHTLFVGLPFSFEGKPYSLFIVSSSKNEATIIRLIVTILLLVLAIGSLCILVAAGYLVRPIKALTRATKQLAQGHFEVELKTKRKDELGMLAHSFNETARELRQLETMRQDFVSNVSHEIQSPLTSITGFAKALKFDRLVTEDHRGRYLDIILAESERLSRLSENLLKLVSLESDHHPFQAATFNLDEQIRQVVVSSEPLWSSKNIRIDLKLPAAAKITADPDQLNQVWINLLGNSIKFTPDRGKIRIALVPNGNELAVTIADSGIGISPEERNRIFERFYKTDRSRSGSGSGLGLAIVKKIIALHQGSIEASGAIGQGTTVTVKLPGCPPAIRGKTDQRSG